MTSTIFATFNEAGQAERAAGALLDHGLTSQDITLLAHGDYDQERRSAFATNANPNEAQRIEHEVEANEVTGTSVGFPGADTTGRSIGEPQDSAFATPGSKMAYGAEMAEGIESTDAATEYPGSDAAFNAPVNSTEPAPNYTEVPPVEPTMQKQDMSAKSGISTTTGSDVGSGALKGVAVGIGVGVLASLAAIFIPGIGLVVGSGALALALEGAAATAGAGAIAGGVVGLLKDQGVPDGSVVIYREAIDNGGAMLAVSIPQNVDRGEVEAVLAKYGAENVELYARG